MQEKFDESGVEGKVLEWLGENGWEVHRGSEESGWGASELDEKYGRSIDEPCYWDHLKEKIKEINDVKEETAKDVVMKLKKGMSSENLLEGNKKFYRMIRTGVKTTVFKDGEKETEVVRVIDKENIENNSFKAVNQFRFVRETRDGIRPDLSLFINGIPLIHIECKSTAQDTYVEDGIKDLLNYQEKEPMVFVSSLFNASVDGERFRYGAVESSEKYFFPWRSEDYNEEDLEAKDAVKDLFKKEKIIDIFDYFVFYEENDTKIVPRYMQYRAANKLLDRIKKGKRRKGLIWHTQGSGKSYTMLYTAYKAKRSEDIEEKQYVIVVDREKLNEQMKDTLNDIDFPLFSVAKSIDHLEELLSENKSQLILTTVQKFQDVEAEINAEVDMDTVILVDEAHRFMEKKLGNKLKAAIPKEKRFYFGFTGTPVKQGNSEADQDTFREFSHSDDEGYLHRYSIKRGQEDGVITSVTFRKKKVKWDIPEEELDKDFEGEFEDLEPEKKQEIIKNYVNQTELVELRPRLEKVVKKIHEHFTENVQPNGFKGMVVTPSRRAAALYGDELKKYFDPEEIEVLITASGNDEKQIKKYHMTSEEERDVIKRFKKEKDPKILVVCDKLLTGFDAPVLKTMYLDRVLKDHNLLQAIARTNRPFEGKENGEIVDFQGVFEDIEEMLNYDDIVLDYAVKEEEEIVKEFKDKVDELLDIFEDIDLENDPEVLHECIVKLEKYPEIGVKFERVYKEAQNKYETLCPHEELGKDPLETNWEILTQIFARYKDTEQGGRSNLEDNVREKTRKILERNIDVSEIEDQGKVEYEIKERETRRSEKARQPENQYGFINRAKAKKRTMEEREDKNIVYEKLSERVKEIIEKWRNDEITGSEGIEELEEIEEESENLEDEKEKEGMTDTEYAIFKKLQKDFKNKVSDEEEGKEIAKEIGSRVEGISLRGYLPEIRKDIRRQILYSLKNLGRTDLYSKEESGFVNQTISYILANKE